MKTILPLRVIIPLLLMLSAAVAGVGSFFYMSSQGEQKVEEESIKQTRQMLNLLQASTNIMLRRKDFDGVRIQLTSLATDHYTNFVMIVDELGKVMLSAHQQHQGKAIGEVADFLKVADLSKLLKLTAGDVSLSQDKLNVHAMYPVYLPETSGNLRSNRIGLLVFAKNISHDKLIEQINIKSHVAMFLIIMASLSALLWLIFHFTITQRVNRLVQTTSNISEGNLYERTGLEGRDEFARIGQALDVMAEALHTRQHELAVSEQRLRKSQSLAKMGCWDWNIITGELFWSETIAPMFGLNVTEDQINYDLFINSVHPDDRQLVKDTIQECLETGIEYDIEHRIVQPNGNIVWVQESGNVECDAEGKPVHMLGVIRDITERKEFYTHLQKLVWELHYQKYALDQHSIVAVTDLKGVISYANAKFSEISGYSCEELLGQTHKIVNSGVHSKEFFTDMWRTISTGKIWRGEVCNRTKGGELYWTETTIVPYLNKNGKRDRYIAIRTNISRRKHVEEQLQKQAATLKESEERFSLAIRGSNDGIWDWDLDTAKIFFSPRWKQMLGYELDEIDNSFIAWRDLVHPDDLGLFLTHWTEYMEGESESFSIEYRIRRKTGEYACVLCRGLSSRSDAGHINRLSGSQTDITERQHLQKQLQQAQKMEAIGQLTGGIAHDFNNMLAAILGYTELANEENARHNNELIKKYLGEVLRSGQRARDLVAQMLTFSRHNEGDLLPHLLSPLIKESLKMLGSTLPSSVEIELRLETDDRLVMTNPVQLHQLIMNLCINARDAMAGYGHITIGLEQVKNIETECDSCHERVSGNYIQLSVSDTGCGLQQEQLDRIFDPFFTTKDAGKGTGMGLAMVHGIMHDHGGHVVVKTEAEKGTTFTLLFPETEISDEIANAEDGNVNSSSDQMITGNILIVDDETAVGLFIGELMKSRGCTVTVESDSQSALSTFNSNPEKFDLVVTDQTMPGMTGVELAEIMMAVRPGQPVILCSGYSGDVDEAKAHSLGIRGYINKPIDTDQFFKLVKTLL